MNAAGLVYVAAVLGVAMFIRSAFGFAQAAVAMPLLTLVISPRLATPLLAAFSLLASTHIILAYWKLIDWKGTARLSIGAFAGIELAGRGVFTAAIAAYGTFVVAQLAVVYWGRWQLHRARLRLAAARAGMHRRRVT